MTGILYRQGRFLAPILRISQLIDIKTNALLRVFPVIFGLFFQFDAKCTKRIKTALQIRKNNLKSTFWFIASPQTNLLFMRWISLDPQSELLQSSVLQHLLGNIPVLNVFKKPVQISAVNN